MKLHKKRYLNANGNIYDLHKLGKTTASAAAIIAGIVGISSHSKKRKIKRMEDVEKEFIWNLQNNTVFKNMNETDNSFYDKIQETPLTKENTIVREKLYKYSKLGKFYKFVDDSKADINRNDLNAALGKIRKGIDGGVKLVIEQELGAEHCKQKIIDNITLCAENEFFEKTFIKDLHRARIICNRELHYNETEKKTTLDDATFAHDVLKKLVHLLDNYR